MGFSYKTIINDRDKFRKACTAHGDSFNRFDEPDLKYFKIFFYFINGNEEKIDIINSSGLLAPTWNIDKIGDNEYYKYNSAWAYLKNNGEDARADMLKEFVTLLSNISSESPWYFKEISGLDKALERNFKEAKFVEDEKKSISIKCMEEPYDDRIGTLLDLYRAAAFSWINKKEIIPANLRKFDMGIYIYSAPKLIFHHIPPRNKSAYSQNEEYSNIDTESGYQTSYKYIELHNCEIDYNSPTSGYGTLNNADGNKFENTINIFFDDCYEKRLNEFSAIQASDFVQLDFFAEDVYQGKSLNNIDLLKRAYYFDMSPAAREIIEPEKESPFDFIKRDIKNMIPDKNMLKNAGDEVIGLAKDATIGLVKSIWLGNLYKGSLSNLSMQVGQAMDGDIITTARNAANIARDIKNANKKKHINNDLGNLYEANTIKNNI